jgi:hypothetical protein
VEDDERDDKAYVHNCRYDSNGRWSENEWIRKGHGSIGLGETKKPRRGSQTTVSDVLIRHNDTMSSLNSDEGEIEDKETPDEDVESRSGAGHCWRKREAGTLCGVVIDRGAP